MFKLVWMVLVMTAQGIQGGQIIENKPYDTVAACEQRLAAVKDRFPDFARGIMNVDFDTELAVEGACVPVGDPA